MEKEIKISVVVPVYNTERYLRACLNSLHNQDFKDVEFICVDDGSTDKSLDILKEFAQRDERFVVISQNNGGPAKARNTALSKARGEYIGFVDSDDYLVSGAYGCIYNIAKKNNADIVVFGAYTEPDNAPDWIKETLSPRDVVYDKFVPEVLFKEKGARPFLWLQLVKRDIIVKHNLHMDESLRLGEDQLFQMAYFPYAKKIVFTSEKYYIYRWQRENSIMATYKDDQAHKLLTHTALIEKAFEQIKYYDNADALRKEVLVWSIFFIWGDLINQLSKVQNEIASKLKKIYEKNNYRKYYADMDCWGQKRLDQIMLMAANGENYNEKINSYKKAIADVEAEIDSIKKSRSYRKYAKRENSLFVKFTVCLRDNGWKYTLIKVRDKLFKRH